MRQNLAFGNSLHYGKAIAYDQDTKSQKGIGKTAGKSKDMNGLPAIVSTA